MKVNLIVTATGPNNGRAIPIVGGKFLVGRDPQCHLRPASQAISKLHCAILVRDGKVFAQDFGSTNGTQLDGETFTGERELKNGSALKMGPLEFRVEIIPAVTVPDSTPLPEALKPVPSDAATNLAAAAGQPAPTAPAKPAAPEKVPVPAASEEDHDAAALLLGMDDDTSSNPQVPEGSTVFEMPAVNPDGTPVKKEDPKKKGTPSAGQMSAAANDILRKYIRRTGN